MFLSFLISLVEFKKCLSPIFSKHMSLPLGPMSLVVGWLKMDESPFLSLEI